MYSTVFFMQLDDFYAELKWEFHTWGKLLVYKYLFYFGKGLVDFCVRMVLDIAISYTCTCTNPLKLSNSVYGHLYM